MADGVHLGDEVEIVSDDFASMGAPRGSIGVIVNDWSDGSNDVEVSDLKTGDVVARFRAAESEIRPYSGPLTEKDPREHGILFGRGDELADDVEAPPMPAQWGAIQIPGYTSAPMAFSQPPPESVELEGDVPWELRDSSETKDAAPTFASIGSLPGLSARRRRHRGRILLAFAVGLAVLLVVVLRLPRSFVPASTAGAIEAVCLVGGSALLIIGYAVMLGYRRRQRAEVESGDSTIEKKPPTGPIFH